MTRTRVEVDREDLLAEAVNLQERIELQVPGFEHPVTIGCNDWGHWSFYFGAEPMYRFDGEGRLRRAVRDGKLYRTQGTTLAELERVRTEQEAQLRRGAVISASSSIHHASPPMVHSRNIRWSRCGTDQLSVDSLSTSRPTSIRSK